MHSLLHPRTKWTPPGDDPHSGEGIPRPLRRRLEASMRCDFSAVRLQIDPSLAAHGVLAAAEGGRIHLSPQAPDLATPAGVAILGHELAHVMQQRQGRVRVLHDGSIVVDDAALEREADLAGLHCVASLFPGVIADPGWPEALRYAPSQDAAGRSPVQFVVSAQESFADFVTLAFQQLAQTYGRVDRTRCESGLRNICYDYRSDKVHEKKPLAGAARCDAMNALLDVTQEYLVMVQSLDGGAWPYLPLDRSPLKKYFTDRGIAFKKNPWSITWPKIPSIGVSTRKQAIDGTPGNMSLDALNGTYLHVFLKEAEELPIMWRICLNVRPDGILQAVNDIAPMMNKYPCINQMKFAVPAVTNKADSVIVYMNAVDDTFDVARTQIRQLAANLPLQARVGAMMNEVVDGVGEGSEPPSTDGANAYYGSFTEVRCRVFYVAFEWMVRTVAQKERSLPAFLDALCWVMPCLGLDPSNPQMQRPFNKWMPGQRADLVRQLYLGNEVIF